MAAGRRGALDDIRMGHTGTMKLFFPRRADDYALPTRALSMWRVLLAHSGVLKTECDISADLLLSQTTGCCTQNALCSAHVPEL